MNAARKVFEALARSEHPFLTPRQVAILFILCHDDALHTVRGVAQKLDVTKPIVTRAITAFEEIGFARRAPNPDDGRDVFLVPTDAAFAFVQMLTDAAQGEAA